MGLSSKKTKTTSKETIGPSAFAQPFVSEAASTFKPAYDKGMAIADSYQPGLAKAGGFFGDIIGGKYLDNDPYLEGVISSSNRDITDSVNSQLMPRFGSAYHTNALVDRLSQNENNLRYGNLQRERDRQMDAAGGLGDIATRATLLPSIPASTYGDQVGGLLGRYLTSNGTSTTKSKGSLISQLAKAAQAAATVASDRRLKTDIVKLGEESDGLGVYQYRYVTDAPDAPLRQGVMADEVARYRPWALGETRNGFATVNMGAL